MSGPLFSPTNINSYAAPLAQQPSQPVPRPREGAGFGPYAAILAANGLDLASSLYGMNKGYTHEANPLMSGLADDPRVGVIAGKALSALAGTLATHSLASSGHPTAAKVVGYLSSVPSAWATYHNVQQINQARRGQQ